MSNGAQAQTFDPDAFMAKRQGQTGSVDFDPDSFMAGRKNLVTMYDAKGNRVAIPREQTGLYRDKGYTVLAPGGETEFEKARPGKGITLEGAGSAFLNSLKGMLPEDPTGGHSLFSKGAWLGEDGPFTFDPTHGGLAEAARETKAGWERGRDPRAKLGEAVSSGLGSFVGMSGREAAALGERGEGGQILGKAAVPAGLAVAAPLASEAMGAARPALQRAGYRELPANGPQLNPGASRLGRAVGAAGGAGLGHATGIPGAGYAGGVAGFELGPSLVKQVLGTPELGDIRNPGPFSKVPLKAPSSARTSVLGNKGSLPRGSPTLFGSAPGQEPMVLSPEEWAQKDTLQQIAAQRAKERGMQYAGGVRTAGRNKPVNRLFPLQRDE